MRALICSVVAAAASSAVAQPDMPSKVPLTFDHYYRYGELEKAYKDIGAAYPDLVEIRKIGQSGQGRDMWVAIVNAPKAGAHTAKPAMWIDGNVHGNEIQAAEVVLYSIWYLTKAYGVNPDLTKLLDNYSFYFLPSQNPDGRENWFERPNNSSSSRSNLRPVDDDRDGLFDEDPSDDLDGDGSITQMWKADPSGRFIRDRVDPRIFRRVGDLEKGEWTPVGSEGIDNDGDGQINEDGPGGDDMNRNWPGDWQPNFVQFGAGPYPFSNPETRSIGRFIMDHPNIGALQSYHNAGGMILRGPGASYREYAVPGGDARVYEEIQATGEKMLPYYRAMVTFRDLYTVHGGFTNWAGETLGMYAFTNEMFNEGMYFQRDTVPTDEANMWLFRDKLQFGQVFKDYTEFDHPLYGKVLIGGLNKWASRVTPTFMLEAECHRNFAFTMFHADQMPIVRFDRAEVAQLPGGSWTLTVEVRNEKLMPTRSAIQRSKRIGENDLLTCEPSPGGVVGAAGFLDSWIDTRMDPIRYEPGRIQLEGGIPGRGGVIVRYYLTGKEGDKVTLRYQAEKAKLIERTVELKATPK